MGKVVLFFLFEGKLVQTHSSSLLPAAFPVTSSLWDLNLNRSYNIRIYTVNVVHFKTDIITPTMSKSCCVDICVFASVISKCPRATSVYIRPGAAVQEQRRESGGGRRSRSTSEPLFSHESKVKRKQIKLPLCLQSLSIHRFCLDLSLWC